MVSYPETRSKKNPPSAVATVQVDDERELVTECRFAARAETGWHRHEYDYVVVPMTTGKLLLETEDGNKEAKLSTGQSYSNKIGVEHKVVNANDFEFVFVEVELK